MLGHIHRVISGFDKLFKIEVVFEFGQTNAGCNVLKSSLLDQGADPFGEAPKSMLDFIDANGRRYIDELLALLQYTKHRVAGPFGVREGIKR